MKKISLTLILSLFLSNNAFAAVKRGHFTSDGTYVMDYQKNDYKKPQENDYKKPQKNDYYDNSSNN
jgi:hypothetical protein